MDETRGQGNTAEQNIVMGGDVEEQSLSNVWNRRRESLGWVGGWCTIARLSFAPKSFSVAGTLIRPRGAK